MALCCFSVRLALCSGISSGPYIILPSWCVNKVDLGPIVTRWTGYASSITHYRCVYNGLACKTLWELWLGSLDCTRDIFV